MKVKSFGGPSYFVTFVDNDSMKVWAYTIKNKSDVFDVVKNFHTSLKEKPVSHFNVLEVIMVVNIVLLILMSIVARMLLGMRKKLLTLSNTTEWLRE